MAHSTGNERKQKQALQNENHTVLLEPRDTFLVLDT